MSDILGVYVYAWGIRLHVVMVLLDAVVSARLGVFRFVYVCFGVRVLFGVCACAFAHVSGSTFRKDEELATVHRAIGDRR